MSCEQASFMAVLGAIMSAFFGGFAIASAISIWRMTKRAKKLLSEATANRLGLDDAFLARLKKELGLYDENGQKKSTKSH